MKVKAFNIRLDAQHLVADQEAFNNFAGNVDVRKSAVELMGDAGQYWSVLLFYNEGPPPPSTKLFFPAGSDLSEEEKRRLVALKDWRTEKAATLQVPSYLVCSNAQLVSVAKVRPRSAGELINIKGFAGQKTARYGEEIVSVLNSVV